MEILTTEQVAAAEKLAIHDGVTALTIMNTAGKAAFQEIVKREKSKSKKIAVLCGKGNNGGDALVVAQLLLKHGYQVALYLVFGIPQSELSRRMLKTYLDLNGVVYNLEESTNAELKQLYQSDIFIDGIFGIGFSGELSETLQGLFSFINQRQAILYALDIPSGIEANDGKLTSVCLHATYTITFSAYKPAHALIALRKYFGKVIVVDIGIDKEFIEKLAEPLYLTTEQEFFRMLKSRPLNSYKGLFGKLLCYCGSTQMLGAATIATKAAYRTGAGLVYTTMPESAVSHLAEQIPEAIAVPILQNQNHNDFAFNYKKIFDTASGVSAALIGCGLSQDIASKRLVTEIIKQFTVPYVVDAEALNIVAENPHILLEKQTNSVIITPHYGEMARLIDQSIEYVQKEKFAVAKRFAKDYQVFVVLKGSMTIIATPSGELYVNTTGNPGLAKAGSGDALAGTIAAFLAQGKDALQAAQLGVYLHGAAADATLTKTGEYAMMITDVIEEYGNILSVNNIL